MVVSIKKIKNNRAFTLVETLIVVGIISLLATSAILVYQSVIEKNALYDGSRLIVTIMEKYAEDSKLNVDDAKHGVKFDDSITEDYQFIGFTGDDYASASDTTTYSISDRVYIDYTHFYDTVGSYDNEVIFDQGSGLPNYDFGEIRLQARNTTSRYVILYMNKEGRWEIEEHY